MRRPWLLVLAVSSLLLTWPLVMKMGSSIPLGSEASPAVPFLNVWTMGWNGVSLRSAFQGYWDAPIFYPNPGAFALSDPQPITGIPAALFWKLSPASAYNLTLLIYLTLNGLVAYHVLRRRGAPERAALLGAVMVQALPFITHERGVLQLQPLFAPLWTMHAFWEVFDRPSMVRGLRLGAAIGITFLTSEYYLLLLTPALGVAALWNLIRLRGSKLWGAMGLAALVAGGMMLPIALPQAKILGAAEFSRSAASLARTSAWPVDYLKPSPRLRISAIAPAISSGSIQNLYPGASLVALAALGVIHGWRKPGDRRWVGFLATSAAIAFAISLGPHLRLGDWSPYLSLHQAIPILRWTRSPFRFAALVQLALALLAAAGLGRIDQLHRKLFWAAAAVVVLELAPLPERLVQVPEPEPAWAAHAAGPVAHLPWVQGSSASAYADTTAWMIQSLGANVWLANGYSGFFPITNAQLKDDLRGFPTERGLSALQSLGVKTVVLHAALDAQQEKRLQLFMQRGAMTLMHAGPDGDVYLLEEDGP